MPEYLAHFDRFTAKVDNAKFEDIEGKEHGRTGRWLKRLHNDRQPLALQLARRVTRLPVGTFREILCESPVESRPFTSGGRRSGTLMLSSRLSRGLNPDLSVTFPRFRLNFSAFVLPAAACDRPICLGLIKAFPHEVAGDWVVELVGLEPATRLLWAAVRVRPAPQMRALDFGSLQNDAPDLVKAAIDRQLS